MLDEIKEKDFDTEEEAQAYFDKLAVEKWSSRKIRRPVQTIDWRDKKDPYYAYFKEDPREDVSAIYENEWILDNENTFKELDLVESVIARYPLGFRYYENYQAYKVAKPGATIDEYAQDSKQRKHSYLKNSHIMNK